jgi:acyl carrier protein
MDVTTRIREVLDAEGRLGAPASALDDSDNLYARGLTSHASVSVMLALEDTFGIEFPDTMLNKKTFESVGAIKAALGELGVSDENVSSAVD